MKARVLWCVLAVAPLVAGCATQSDYVRPGDRTFGNETQPPGSAVTQAPGTVVIPPPPQPVVVQSSPAPVVVSPPAPSVYVERNDASQAPQAGDWYYCDASRAYYPYVKDGPGGWRAVSPTPGPAR